MPTLLDMPIMYLPPCSCLLCEITEPIATAKRQPYMSSETALPPPERQPKWVPLGKAL